MKNNIKRYFLISWLLSTPNLIHAQTKISTQYRDFNVNPVFKIGNIIDSREHKSIVGEFINDEKKIESIVTDDSLHIFLKTLFHNCTKVSENVAKYTFTLKINHLEFDKRNVETKDRYWVFCDFDIFVNNSDNTYSKIFSGVEALEGIRASDDKSLNDDHLFTRLNWYFWDTIYQKFSPSKIRNGLKEVKKMSFEEIYSKNECPVIFCKDSIKVGSYFNKNDLLANKPITEHYNIKDTNLTIKNEVENTIQTIPSSLIYAYYDGKQLFINYNFTKNYVPVERLGTVFEAAGFTNKVNNSTINNRMGQMAWNTSRAVVNPSGLNSGLAVVSAVGLLVGLLNDNSNSRLMFDIRSNGEHRKIPFVALR